MRRDYPHTEKNIPYGYLFISYRDMVLYTLYTDGASPKTILEMPVCTVSSGNLYRILSRVEWILERYDNKKEPIPYWRGKRPGMLYPVELASRKNFNTATD